MNSKHNNDPTAMTLRVWVIEHRDRYVGSKWRNFDIRTKEDFNEMEIVKECSRLSERYTGEEFRYRAATLTFDDDGSKATIY